MTRDLEDVFTYFLNIVCRMFRYIFDGRVIFIAVMMSCRLTIGLNGLIIGLNGLIIALNGLIIALNGLIIGLNVLKNNGLNELYH